MSVLYSQLLSASYKNVSFLVKGSSITFGQKNVVHRYPGSSRTEVEYLGLDQDQFSLEIFIHGDNYKRKRDALKKALSSEGYGMLVHPVEGEVLCAITGKPTLAERESEEGIASFTVVFQKVSNADEPSLSSDFRPQVRQSSLGSLLDAATSIADSFIVTFAENFEAAEKKLNGLVSVFDDSYKSIKITADKVSEINSAVRDFESKIIKYVNDSKELANGVHDLMSKIDLISDDPFSQFTILENLFDFGSNDKEPQYQTAQTDEGKKNDEILTNAVRSSSTALMYSTLTLADFGTNEKLDFYKGRVQDAFDVLVMEGELRKGLYDTRALFEAYLAGLDLNRIVEKEVSYTPLSVVTYSQYGSQDNYNVVLELNEIKNAGFVNGTTKVITND